jgi:rhodanese-related sulfurtransferase
MTAHIERAEESWVGLSGSELVTLPQPFSSSKEVAVVRKSVLQMWAEANDQVEVLSPTDLAKELEAGDVLLLDTRLPKEIERTGTIEGSVPVPRQVVEWWADPDSPYFRTDGVFGDFDQRLVTFCDGGGNGALTAVTLQELGYSNVATLEGGFYGWVGAELPTVPPK